LPSLGEVRPGDAFRFQLSAFSFQHFSFSLEVPCRSMESAIKLVERFIAGVTKP
jgi:hypothetical protein